MTFADLALYFEKLEKTASRNSMTEILAELFKKSPSSDIDKTCYLLQGRVVPLYEPIEFGMADKMVIKAAAAALMTSEVVINETFKRDGDLGTATAKLKIQNSRPKADQPLAENIKSVTKNLKVSEVYEALLKLAKTTGIGSQEIKVTLLSNLIKKVDPLSSRYIVRIVLAKLRLGFSDMTILDSLSWMLVGSKSVKKKLEQAYNVRPDLGFVARVAKEKGTAGLMHIQPTPGTPIMMARANRLSSAVEILEKIGRCAVEYKYDGLRLQVHYKKSSVVSHQSLDKKGNVIKLFSRNLEDITSMFPDIVEAVKKQINCDEAIFEGEIVAYNPQTGVFVPFQETMQRKRKYDIEAKTLEIPVKLFAFELLYCDGKSFLQEVYEKRKQKLKQIIKTGTLIIYAQEKLVEKADDIDRFFDDSVAKHFEGIIAKKLDGFYEAGVRGWNWIKYKKAMNKKLADTLDVLVMGYTKGEGKRAAFGVGQFLTGVYDPKKDTFVTVSKIGTGLTDEQFREFFNRVKKLKTKTKPALYDVEKLLTPDVWLTPSLVVEVGCDEITRSAVHTAGRIMEPSKSGKALSVATPGFALRFPKLVRLRDDKRPEDATTVSEVAKMFEKQK